MDQLKVLKVGLLVHSQVICHQGLLIDTFLTAIIAQCHFLTFPHSTALILLKHWGL